MSYYPSSMGITEDDIESGDWAICNSSNKTSQPERIYCHYRADANYAWPESHLSSQLSISQN